ncbi:hypothetical protein SDC9_90496 [bioreactor metagenome]|uniref:Uncharacterized protein n=1 Tax=bioreactor metagenome TaxID=1076179 RepID=A0A644ZS46_9ZZZZ
MQLAFHFDPFAACFQHRVKECCALRPFGRLVEGSQTYAFSNRKLAAVARLQPFDHTHQCTFTGAVHADQTDMVLFEDVERNAGK